MPLDVSEAPAAASPLWIIALCIALSEAIAGVAAIVTDGTSRMIFTCFATGFPVVIFCGFIWLLVKHTPKLYAPGQFTERVTPEIFRAGIGISQAGSINLGRAVADAMAPLLWDDRGGESLETAAEQVARRFEAAVTASAVTVTLHYLKPGEDDLRIPVTERTTVTELLDGIYLAIVPAVRPDSYGKTWILLGENGEELPGIGVPWARERGMIRDERNLADAGILPGSTLAVVAKGDVAENWRNARVR